VQSPNFMIVGAARSATTSLYLYLDKHPRVYLSKPLVPEPTFFVYPEEYKKGLKYYLETRYRDVDNETAVGEKSTKYMTVPGTAKRISDNFSDMKVIFILRDPVKRAISNYWWSVKNGLEKLSLEEALSQEEEERVARYQGKWKLIEPHSYKSRGFYIGFIRQYLKFFARDKILVLITEEMEKDPDSVVNETFNFLGVDRMKKVPTVRSNETVKHKRPSTKALRHLADLYKKSNEKLEEFLGRRIESWKL